MLRRNDKNYIDVGYLSGNNNAARCTLKSLILEYTSCWLRWELELNYGVIFHKTYNFIHLK